MPVKKPERTRSFLNTIVLVVAIVEPLMTLPQVYEIWSNHSSAGVSLYTWAAYVIAAGIWLLYGLKIKDKPLIVTSTLWVITEGLVVLLGIVY